MNFKKRVNGSWVDTPNYIHNTSTDTITTLPADIYPTDTTATVGLKGQMEQNGTPTPTTPIQPSECGDLETVGVKAGQYKIPISSANTTTPIYLGEVPTTRRIKKSAVSITNIITLSNGNKAGVFTFPDLSEYAIQQYGLCDIAKYDTARRTPGMFYVNRMNAIFIGNSNDTLDTLKAIYDGCTIWYILETPTTGIVNEPLRKIDDYADEVSGITIPTIAGANTISIGTTLEPSEVSINYKGWHPITDVHEAENGQWD